MVLMLARLRFAARPLAPAAALVALALTAGLCGPSAAVAQPAPPLSAGAPRVLVALACLPTLLLGGTLLGRRTTRLEQPPR